MAVHVMIVLERSPSVLPVGTGFSVGDKIGVERALVKNQRADSKHALKQQKLSICHAMKTASFQLYEFKDGFDIHLLPVML